MSRASPRTEESAPGAVVLSNRDSVAHTLTVTIERYGDVIESGTHSVAAGTTTKIPLRDAGAYRFTVDLDGDSTSHRDSLTASTGCRSVEYEFRITSPGDVEYLATVCLD